MNKNKGFISKLPIICGKKASNLFSTILTAFGALTLITLKSTVFADDTGITTYTPGQVSSKLVSSGKNVITAVFGAATLIGVAIIAFKLMASAKRPDEKAQIMEGIVPLAIGAAILGSITIFVGFFYGIGQ